MSDNPTPKTITHESPGNSHAYVKIPTVCLFCARRTLPGDFRWFCVNCLRRLSTKTLRELLDDDEFRMIVSPVMALTEGGR